MLKNKTLRFTDCQYLNDKSEFLYIREPYEKAWAKICKKFKEEFNKSDVDHMIRNLLLSPYQMDEVDYEKCTWEKGAKFNDLVKRYTKTYRYYVLCCSKNEDASNMWNYFVKNGAYLGYNIGIDISTLEGKFINTSNKNNGIEIFSGSVIYDLEQQINILFNKMKEVIVDKNKELANLFATNDMNLFANDMNLFAKVQFGLWSFINKQKLFFKNPAFKNEDEYRFVLKVDNDFREDGGLKLDFRAGESGIITPFIEWKYTLHDKRNLFKQITLAPTIEPTLAEESFKRFLDTTVYQGLKIKPSSIKMRF